MKLLKPIIAAVLLTLVLGCSSLKQTKVFEPRRPDVTPTQQLGDPYFDIISAPMSVR
jgi:hypothetical protein